MDFKDLLIGEKLDPEKVLVLRHVPTEAELRKALPWLAIERPDVFNAYQQTQGTRLEAAMTKAAMVASFIGGEAGRATFVGLFRIAGHKTVARADFWNIPGYSELKPLGMRGFAEEDNRASVEYFDLVQADFYPEWKGKLVVGWPAPERQWWRRAHKNEFPIRAIHEESVFESGMPDWDELSLTWQELKILPNSWRVRLSQWRAIYYVFDERVRKGYVGSAYGGENLLRRWLGYAATGHGGNRLLKQCDPESFRFAILQRVSPDMGAEDVIQLESRWKDRLRTRSPWGLNDN